MSEFYVGEIRMFAGNYAPQGWFICDGSALDINSYTPLFALIGTTYGGNGVSTFNLPDLRGRVPVHQGQGRGLTSRVLGQSFGSESVVLNASNLPTHTHSIKAGGVATTNAATGAYLANTATYQRYAPTNTADGLMNAFELSSEAGVASPLPFPNLMPSVAVNFIIAYTGIYPNRD